MGLVCLLYVGIAKIIETNSLVKIKLNVLIYESYMNMFCACVCVIDYHNFLVMSKLDEWLTSE